MVAGFPGGVSGFHRFDAWDVMFMALIAVALLRAFGEYLVVV